MNKSNIGILNPDNTKMDFDINSLYVPCDYCMKNNEKDYIMETWFKVVQKRGFDFYNVAPILEGFARFHSNKIRLKAYPRFSANVKDFEKDLNILEQTEGFIPDVVITDYVDICKPSSEDLGGVDKEDETWMEHGRLAGERHCLVFSPTQGNRASIDADIIRQKHTARWIGKLGHVDVMIALNQLEEEKERGVMRVSLIAHRHRRFIESDTVTVLQAPDLGQPHLASYYDRD